MDTFIAIQDYIKHILVEEKQIPGCDVIIMRKHKPYYRFSFGFSDVKKTIPVSNQDLYFMYSCTKPMTAVAAMRLVEEGKMGLDKPVAEYLPAYGNVYLLRDGKRVRPENSMTVRHLFTMTAGLDYDLHKLPTEKVLGEYGDAASTQQIVNSFAESPLCFTPGERFQYSLCHDVLAAVVEEVVGMRFSDYMEEVIFKPLGMKDTTFHPSQAQTNRIVAQYESREHTICPVEKKNGFVLSPNYESGGAGLISSVDDYIRFADTLACGGISPDGYRLLKPETIRRMQADQLQALTVDPAFCCAAGPGYSYGLGVRTRISHEGGKSALGEFGWDGAAGSYVMIDPKNRLSIFFAMQVLNWQNCIGCGHAPIRDMTYEALGID